MVQSKNNTKHILIGFCIGIICLVIIPISINKLILKPHLFEIVGTGVDWLTFWGSYLGAIISAGVAFIILHLQRKENETQNKANRQLQINVIKYQQDLQWLNELKAKCVDYHNAFDQNDIINLCNLLNKNDSTTLAEAEQLLNFLIDRNNKVVFALEFQFTNKKDEEEIKLLSKLENYNLVYKALIYDTQYIIRRFRKNADIYNLYAEIDEYEKRNTIPQVTSNRIVSILNSTTYIGVVGGLSDIINKLFIARRDFHPTLIQGTLNELINYEESKINKIIYLEQDVTK